MNSFTHSTEDQTIPKPDVFDPSSGTLVERLLFNHRSIILGVCVLLSLILGYQALSLKLNAAFEKMIPTDHPYVQNYLKNRGQLGEGATLYALRLRPSRAVFSMLPTWRRSRKSTMRCFCSPASTVRT